MLAIPERDRTDEQWDELIELEIMLAPENREDNAQNKARQNAGPGGAPPNSRRRGNNPGRKSKKKPRKGNAPPR